MEREINRPDFLLDDLWRWLQQIEICRYELQESMLLAAKNSLDIDCEDYIVNGTCFVSSLERLKTRLQREIVIVARNFCIDSQEEKPFEGLRIWDCEVNETLAELLSCLQALLTESRECVNILRLLYETPRNNEYVEREEPTVLQFKGGRWIKTYKGNDLEDSADFRKNAFGILKSDFDKQTANILVLEGERNELSLQIEKLKRMIQNCACDNRQQKRKKPRKV
ncbi:hypothetical protein METBIDRAFT_9761 [Metschnikowia bicuspidata var. bicuspidata NRRL YB-4993]|uniref:Uncharacterized protein n=1 Tax=Metschnikowia bicuspidata var. bicuspidata NRRL YB-4993 TaxID=869754 RepID=A0A1A0HI33_9ASCO|nr:hypothetical protein METBIDRAFT_9761 [Metschnikowia bicuspidata var. bicuspidata NRRL YB-4993]OBA23503.1 hypothetical protein METBIDRAFT_9761 [Metschnikowia bicuspidata var. bicuspidata NRRL YB-4993]